MLVSLSLGKSQNFFVVSLIDTALHALATIAGYNTD